MNTTPYPFGKLPLDISTHGAGIDQLIIYVHVFMALLFVGWGIYFLYCLFVFRERPNHTPQLDEKHFSLPKYVEVGIVLVEVVLLVFFSSPVWGKYKNDFPDRKDAVVVRIVAEQFAWNIHYPGKDGKFGKTLPEKMDGTNPTGLDRESENGRDDIVTINNFVVPVNRPIIVDLNSKDVIHSFGIPVARVKQDAVPGMEIPIHFEVKETGEFEIACAQLCGVGHYRMRGQFVVKSAEDYAKWMAEQEAELAKELGDAAPAAETPTAEKVPTAKKAPAVQAAPAVESNSEEEGN